jgi:hypothetical protein
MKKKTPKQILKAKAWKVFGDWIKARDNYICVSCGAFEANQAGHFWHNVLDFDEININCQCIRCNHFLSGNLAPYSAYLIRKHGLRKFNALEKRKNLALGGEYRTELDYEKIIKKYSLSTV